MKVTAVVEMLANALPKTYVCVGIRYKESHVVTARAAVTVIHPELGCLISSTQLQNYSVILLYAQQGSSPGQHVWLPVAVKVRGGYNKKAWLIAKLGRQMVKRNTPVTAVHGCAQWEGEATHCSTHCRRKRSGLSCYPAPGSMQSDLKSTPIHPFSTHASCT